MDAQAVAHSVLGRLTMELSHAVQHGLMLLKYYLCHKMQAQDRASKVRLCNSPLGLRSGGCDSMCVCTGSLVLLKMSLLHFCGKVPF